MTQYCRYCAYLVTGNGIACTADDQDRELSEEYTKRTNHCPKFEFNEIDSYDLSKRYTPRRTRAKALENVRMDL